MKADLWPRKYIFHISSRPCTLHHWSLLPFLWPIRSLQVYVAELWKEIPDWSKVWCKLRRLKIKIKQNYMTNDHSVWLTFLILEYFLFVLRLKRLTYFERYWGMRSLKGIREEGALVKRCLLSLYQSSRLTESLLLALSE